MFPLDAILGIGSKLIDKFFPDPQAKAAAQLELLKMQQSGDLAKMANEVQLEQEITKRWEADMTSDSWLSKNIRPMALLIILAGYFFFAFLSAIGVEANSAYVELLGEWGKIVMLAYFSGRTIEKGIDIYAKNKGNGNGL